MANRSPIGGRCRTWLIADSPRHARSTSDPPDVARSRRIRSADRRVSASWCFSDCVLDPVREVGRSRNARSAIYFVLSSADGASPHRRVRASNIKELRCTRDWSTPSAWRQGRAISSSPPVSVKSGDKADEHVDHLDGARDLDRVGCVGGRSPDGPPGCAVLAEVVDGRLCDRVNQLSAGMVHAWVRRPCVGAARHEHRTERAASWRASSRRATHRTRRNPRPRAVLQDDRILRGAIAYSAIRASCLHGRSSDVAPTGHGRSTKALPLDSEAGHSSSSTAESDPAVDGLPNPGRRLVRRTRPAAG
jgi:hypothetical protein